MAEKTEVITVKINGVETSLNSIKDVKKAIKELNSQALFGDREAAKNVAELKDKLEDLGDTTRSLKGDGIEPLKGSFGLLSEGFASFDMDKIKTGFKGVGEAMGAIPIFLLIEGVKLLIDNFDKVIDFFKAFTQAAKDNAAAIKEVNAAYNEVSQNLQEIDERQESLIKNGEQRNKLAIEQAKRRGATEKEINDLEIQGTKNKLEVLSKAEENYRKQKEYADAQLSKASQLDDEEAYKKAKEISDKANAAYIESRKTRHDTEREIQLQESINQTEAYQKWQEQQNAKAEYIKKVREDSKKSMADALNDEEEFVGFEKIIKDHRLEDDKAFNDQQKENAKDRIESEIAWEKKLAEQKAKALSDFKASEVAKKQATINGLTAAQSLSDTFYTYQLNRVKGNATAELAIKKKMFEVDKAFSVARAVIDGIRSVQAALTIPPPGGEILAVVNGVMAAANVAKILSTKFDGGSADVGSVSAPSVNANVPVSLPQPSTSTAPTTQAATTFDSNGRNTSFNVTAHVVESEVTDAQNRQKKMDRLSTF